MRQQAALTAYPSPILTVASPRTKEEKISLIADRFREIMEILGLDLEDDSLTRTPERVAKMYVNEIFSGLDPENFPAISVFDDPVTQEHSENMVFVRTTFCSFCEHHFVPMVGTAYVAYLPNGKIIGLSKIPRIVRFFARRPQVQERLSAQIADSLSLILNTDHVAVSITAQHYCILARGIEDQDSHAVTNILNGRFASDHALRHNFFEAINRRT